jgi:16S rRNA (cytosine967-C5)-methyltransferase
MTPNARYAAAIDILDAVLAGEPAEKTLTNWARSNRYAGSKDRACVRDIVFDCLRQRRSFMHSAGFDGARGLVAGHILAAGQMVDAVYTGERFAAGVLSDAERDCLDTPKPSAPDAVRLDIPDWIEPKLRTSLGDGFEPALKALQSRAPLDLRVNVKKAEMVQVQADLQKDGIETDPVNGVPNALRVTCNPRRVALSDAYQNGLVEIQDAGSQAVVAEVPLNGILTVLDYCAGGGGKTLAMAAIADDAVQFDAYDRNNARMNDLPVRAKRAGAKVRVLRSDPVQAGKTYDLVLLDVPCSGTGAWRRNPNGKWRFGADELQSLQVVQADILGQAQALVANGGVLAYVTCSLLHEENEAQVASFLAAYDGWAESVSRRFYPHEGSDGFFLAVLKKNTTLGCIVVLLGPSLGIRKRITYATPCNKNQNPVEAELADHPAYDRVCGRFGGCCSVFSGKPESLGPDDPRCGFRNRCLHLLGGCGVVEKYGRPAGQNIRVSGAACGFTCNGTGFIR